MSAYAHDSLLRIPSLDPSTQPGPPSPQGRELPEGLVIQLYLTTQFEVRISL